MRSLIKTSIVVLLLSLAGFARADSFPQTVDYLVRAVEQKLPSPLVMESLSLTDDISSWSQTEVAAIQARAQALSSTNDSQISQLKIDIKDQAPIQCLASVVKNSTRFINMDLGPYSDRAATVIIRACRRLVFNLEYDVILNLEKDLAFSSMSRSQTFAIAERLDVSQKKLLCMAEMTKDSMPRHAVAVYDVGSYYIIGVGTAPTGELSTPSSDGNNYDFPVGLEGMQDQSSILNEVLPTIDFFRSLDGRFQLVFKKSDCTEEGFDQGWPSLYCGVKVPEAYRKNNVEELRFRFGKTILVTREVGMKVESEVFSASFDFISSELSVYGAKKLFTTNLKFENQNNSNPCQF